MRIWVDADACPGVIKDVLFRAAKRCEIRVTLVANMSLHTPASEYVDSVVVRAGADVADAHIAQNTQSGDIVVTADIPLAARVVDAGGVAIDPRGELYTEQNIGSRLQARNLMDQLRGTGMDLGGPPRSTIATSRHLRISSTNCWFSCDENCRDDLWSKPLCTSSRFIEPARAASVRCIDGRSFWGTPPHFVFSVCDWFPRTMLAVDARAW
jgi:hypothetical protein